MQVIPRLAPPMGREYLHYQLSVYNLAFIFQIMEATPSIYFRFLLLLLRAKEQRFNLGVYITNKFK